MQSSNTTVSADAEKCLEELYSKELEAITLGDFINEVIEPRVCILTPWLHERSINMVYAIRGVGKTFFALELAVTVATGGEFLGFKAEKPRKVLYLDGEMPQSAMQGRLQAICKRRDIDPSDVGDNFVLITPDRQPICMPNLSLPAGQALVSSYVDEADLIIVDNIATLCSIGKENNSESWLAMQWWALTLRRQGKTVLFIHHAGKNGTQRGTSGKEDVMDVVIKLQHSPGYEPSMGACFELHYEKSRNILGDCVTPMLCQLKDEDWLCKPLEESNYLKVANLVNEGFKQHEIVESIGLSKAQVSKLAKRAREEGLVKSN